MLLMFDEFAALGLIAGICTRLILYWSDFKSFGEGCAEMFRDAWMRVKLAAKRVCMVVLAALIGRISRWVPMFPWMKKACMNFLVALIGRVAGWTPK